MLSLSSGDQRHVHLEAPGLSEREAEEDPGGERLRPASAACIPLSERFSFPLCSQALISLPSSIKSPKLLPKQRLTDLQSWPPPLDPRLGRASWGLGGRIQAQVLCSQTRGGLVKSLHEALPSSVPERGVVSGKGAGQGPAVDLAQSRLRREACIWLRALGGHGPRPQCSHLLRRSWLQVTTPGCEDFVVGPSARGQGSSAALAPAVQMRVREISSLFKSTSNPAKCFASTQQDGVAELFCNE